MDRSERKDTAQHALVYVAIAVTAVIVLVLLWYAIDVVLLAFIGVLAAILLRAPADWLTQRFGLRERWSLALVLASRPRCSSPPRALFGRGISRSPCSCRSPPEIIEAFKQKLGESELGSRVLALADSSGFFAGGDGQFIGRGLGLIGSTFGAIANVLIVIFFAVFMARAAASLRRGRPVPGAAPAAAIARARCSTRSATCCGAGWSAVAARGVRRAAHRRGPDAGGRAVRHRARAVRGTDGVRALHRPVRRRAACVAGRLRRQPGPRHEDRAAVRRIQLTESYVLAPLVQHKAVYLPPAAILFAQVLMGAIVGALGVAVATPLAAAVMVAVSMLYVEDALGDKNAKVKA
jgi:hypothetical protein